MDTKDKNRSGRRRRPASNADRRSAGNTSRTRQSQTRSSGTEPRRRTPPTGDARQARRTAEQAARRTAPAQQPRRREQVRQQVKSDAPEQVFKPAQEQQIRQRDPQAAKRAAQRRQSAKRAKEREIQKKKQANRPAVEYIPPKPINVNRLLLQIAVVLAVVLAVVMGLSVFFKVEKVMVYGNSAYSAWTVQEAAGIEGGENLWTLNRIRASGKIRSSLPYVERVRIGIKLPDTVNIYIEEADVAYAIRSEDGTWWLMASSGNILEQIDAGTASKHTKIEGVELLSPTIGQQAKAVETVSVETEEPTEAPSDETGPTTEETVAPVTKVVTGADKLKAALTIVNSLELNQIIGEASTIDVSAIDDLQLWYGQQYQVRLGDAERMDHKIASMKAAIAKQKDYEMGILDVSFTQWPNDVGFTPAES